MQEFDITYVPQKAIKGQTLADFIANHPIPNDWEFFEDLSDEDMLFIEVPRPWKLFFDGAAQKDGVGAGVILVTLEEKVLPYAFTLVENCSNYVAEYQALAMGLEMAMELNITRLKVFGDSKLIINQILHFMKLKSLSFYHTSIM